MGFWDLAKEIGGTLIEIVKGSLEEQQERLEKQRERINAYREKYDRMDDDTLIRYYKNNYKSGMERAVIAKILSERGYGSNND